MLESEIISSFDKNKDALLEVLLGFYRKEDWDLIVSRFRKIYFEFASLSRDKYNWYKNNGDLLSLEYLRVLFLFLQDKYIIHKIDSNIQRKLVFDPKKDFFEYDSISEYKEIMPKYKEMLKNSIIQQLPEFQKINERFREKFGYSLSLEEMYGFYLPDFAHCITWLHNNFSIIYFPIYRLLNRNNNLEKSMIHEVIHAVEYGDVMSGINGPNRTYNLTNEVRVDFLAYSVLDECHNQGLNIFGHSLDELFPCADTDTDISYKVLFPLIDDFLSAHQQFINTCAVHNDVDTLIQAFGSEFNDFNDMLKKKLNWVLRLRDDTGETPIIMPTDESKRLIKTLNQNYGTRFSGYEKKTN